MGDFTRLADLMRSGLDLDAALRKLDRTTPTHILPASLGVTTGTPAGGTSFNNILSFTNDLDYEIAEEADTPGLLFYVGFTNVSDFKGLVVSAHYDGTISSHYVEVGIYCYDTASYERTIHFGPDMNATDYRYIELPKSFTNRCIKMGVVTVRFNHPVLGNVAHNFHLDYIALVR